MTSVLLLTRYDRKGASSRLRCLQYLPALEKAGFSITHAPFFDDRYIERLNGNKTKRIDHISIYFARRIATLFGLGKFDLLWVEKELLPWLPGWLERLILSKGNYVLDVDDAWYLRYAAHPSPVVRAMLGRKFDRIVRNAAAVVVANDYLKDWAYRCGAREVAVIPTAVDIDRYPMAPIPDRESFTIGWLGQPSTTKYLPLAMEAVRELSAHGPVRLKLVGAGGFEPIPGIDVEKVAWSEDAEIASLYDFDVGITPLTEGAWEAGKSSFKSIQYMAACRPVVVSRAADANDRVRSENTGILVDNSTAQWFEALNKLRIDRGTARRMGLNGRSTVENHFSLPRYVDRISGILRAAAANER